MGNALRINPFVFLTMNAIQTTEEAVTLAENLFTEVPVEPGIKWIYKALSHRPEPTGPGTTQDVDTFEAAYFDSMNNKLAKSGDVMFVDENGLTNNHNDVWIIIRGAWQPFAGAGLVIGTTRSGDTVEPKRIDMAWLKENVVILCQNLIYVPRVQKLAVTPYGSALHFATRSNMCDRAHMIWEAPNPFA